MKQGSSTSDDPPPYSPLAAAHLLDVGGPEPEGAGILRELPAPAAAHVFSAYRMVLAWARGPAPEAAVLAVPGAAEWEEELLTRPFAPSQLWAPLCCLAGEMRRPESADVPLLVQACLALSEWALEEGAPGTATSIAEAAAVAWPENGQLAWFVGRLLRTHGRLREAGLWLSRADRVAARARDWPTQGLALHSLANLHIQQGEVDTADVLLQRTLRLARRRRVPDREAKVHHDLFLVATMRGDYREAERHGLEAFQAYGPGHPNAPKLAHDIGHLWCDQGRFAQALPVFRALLAHFHAPDERLRGAASVARAAGALGERDHYLEAAAEAERLAPEAQARPVLAESMVQLARGAASMKDWTRAQAALDVALGAARARGEHDTAMRAEAVLDQVRNELSAEAPPPARARARAEERWSASLVSGLQQHHEAVRLVPDGFAPASECAGGTAVPSGSCS